MWFQGSKAVALESADFAKQCVELYEELAKTRVKAYSSPTWDDGALIPADDEIKGQLSPHSAK